MTEDYFVVVTTADAGAFQQGTIKGMFIIRATSIKEAEERLKNEVNIGPRDALVIKPATIENVMALFTFTNHVAQVETVV